MVGVRPIVFVIKNIKAFNHVVLNELIHLLRKYRRPQGQITKHGCNFCLMLGVQNNNREEVHLRINIQNCTKLALKTFYFPSMKNIIFEVIHMLLMTKKSATPLLMPTSLSQSAIQALIEQINLYGMSVDKFKRTLRLILVEHFYNNPFFLMHKSVLDHDQETRKPDSKRDFKSSKFTQRIFLQNEDQIKKRFAD